MDLKYENTPAFQIEFFKITCNNFKDKREHIEEVLKQYPEMPIGNFHSNRNKADFTWQLQEIFKDEFSLIKARYGKKIEVTKAWSVSYNKGDYHIPHNHSSQGYSGIIYLRMKKDSPRTSYIQPWNSERDMTRSCCPIVKEGDIMIVPQFLIHYTEPNKLKFKKRIISFDFV
jgi:hypothetical protein|tara:strand:+ start:19 stop:534 length:516 start_codon:yes stop_codon:yes gene_type:complete